MKSNFRIAGVAVLVATGLSVLLAAQESPADIDGTYRLVARELPDGTRHEPPRIQGLITFTDGYRNFNIYWTDDSGKRTSISSISTYTLTEDEYTETSLYYMTNDEIEGAGLSYDLSGPSGSSPVSREDGRIAFSLPLFGEPDLVFNDDDTFTASREGEFVDHWEEVE